jgi:hypothetical protein
MCSIQRNSFGDEIISVMICLPLRYALPGQVFVTGTSISAKSTKKYLHDKRLVGTGRTAVGPV